MFSTEYTICSISFKSLIGRKILLVEILEIFRNFVENLRAYFPNNFRALDTYSKFSIRKKKLKHN